MQRKHPRLKGFDYTSAGGYFVTVCTREKRDIFGISPVGRGPCAPPNAARIIAEEWIAQIPKKFPSWSVEHWVVMPNHIHLLLQTHADGAAGHTAPALQDIIRWYKTMTTNACIRSVRAGNMPPFERSIWQTSFYDEVIRSPAHYLRIWKYIDENPARWSEDEYYVSLR